MKDVCSTSKNIGSLGKFNRVQFELYSWRKAETNSCKRTASNEYLRSHSNRYLYLSSFINSLKLYSKFVWKGLCLLAKGTLKMIPVSVLFGIFLYFGIVSLSGTQLYERIKLIFIPSKYCPNVVYARGVRPSKRNLFTIIQITAVFVLLVMKSFNQISFTFPIVLVLLVPLRNVILPKIFTNKELEQVNRKNIYYKCQ